MSYDLAVWEGARPDDDDAATEEFEVLYQRYVGTGGPSAPTPRIAAYVTALLDRYPDINTEAGFHDSPWASAPLMSEASGPLVYFPMVASRGDETAVWAAQVAEEHGLVCFDPQTEQLRTPWGKPWRFEFTSVFGDSLRNPGDVGDILAQLSVDDPFALLTAADGSYLRVECTGLGRYALERGAGHRIEGIDLDEATRAFADFLAA
jgi:hypothetical protein